MEVLNLDLFVGFIVILQRKMYGKNIMHIVLASGAGAIHTNGGYRGLLLPSIDTKKCARNGLAAIYKVLMCLPRLDLFRSFCLSITAIDWFGESLDSILAQTYPNFEVIAINDGSTDNTAAVLEEYAQRDARIRVIHQTNARLPRTLSRGFRMAKGQYLTWTSDDNHFKSDFLECMVTELNSTQTLMWRMLTRILSAKMACH